MILLLHSHENKKPLAAAAAQHHDDATQEQSHHHQSHHEDEVEHGAAGLSNVVNEVIKVEANVGHHDDHHHCSHASLCVYDLLKTGIRDE